MRASHSQTFAVVRVALVALCALIAAAMWRRGDTEPVAAAPPAVESAHATENKSAPDAARPSAESTTKPAADEHSRDRKPAAEPKHTTENVRGRIVWLAEALKERYGISTDDDAAHSQIALAAIDGRLYPIVKDNRGRGFWIDPRLQDFDLELTVRRFEGSPLVQVVRVYSIHDGERFELDYWCDICSIPMYELKDCECCQGATRFRERPVDKTGP